MKNYALGLLLAATLSFAEAHDTKDNAHSHGDHHHHHENSVKPFQKHGTLEFKDFGFRALKGAKNGSAYVTITQTGKESDLLVQVKCAHAKSVELHDHILDKETGAKKMTPIPSIEIPGTHSTCNFITCWLTAKQHTISLTKGEKHIMLMGIDHSVTKMTKLPITLVFAKAGEVTLGFVPESTLASNDCECDCPEHKHKHHDHTKDAKATKEAENMDLHTHNHEHKEHAH